MVGDDNPHDHEADASLHRRELLATMPIAALGVSGSGRASSKNGNGGPRYAMTENHKFATKSNASAGWHGAVSNNFERIDTELEIRDLAKNRSEYDPKAGAKFHATDTGSVYLGDGNSWVLAPARYRSLQAQQTNGVYYVDDITDLQSTIDSISASPGRDGQGGGKVVLNSGEHDLSRVSLPITLKPGISLEGDGNAPTFLNADGVSSTVFKFDNSDGPHSSYVHLRNLAIDGDRTPGGIGAEFIYAHWWTIEDCRFRNLDIGVRAAGSYIGTLKNVVCRQNKSDGLLLEQTPTTPYLRTNAFRIIGGSYLGNTGRGINAQDLTQLHVFGPDIESNLKEGLLLDNVGPAFINAYFESNGSDLSQPYDLSISPDICNHYRCDGIAVIGSQFSPLGTAIKIGFSRAVTISSCRFWGKSGTNAAIELSGNIKPKNSNCEERPRDMPVMESVTIDPMNYRELENTIVPPLDSAPVKVEEVNEGVWSDQVFGGLAEIENALSTTAHNDLDNALTVLITEETERTGSTVIDGSNYPGGTKFKAARGNRSITLKATEDGEAVVDLPQLRQSIEGFEIDASGLSNSAGVRLAGNESQARNIYVAGAGSNGGIVTKGSRCVTSNCVCNSSNISGLDIDDNGANNRHIGNDADIDTSNATNPALAGNTDSA